jgi:hypothetical protein
MKTLLRCLCIFVIAAAPAFAETPAPQLDGFLDIPFGSNQDTVKKQLPNRAHTRLDRTKSRDNYLWFEGGKFAGFKIAYATLEFITDRLWNVGLHLQAVSKDHAKEFATLQQMLTEKYGPGKDEPTEAPTSVWYIPGPNGVPNTIRITTDPTGVGAIVWYLSDDVRQHALAKPAAPQPAKPIKTNPAAKDDL